MAEDRPTGGKLWPPRASSHQRPTTGAYAPATRAMTARVPDLLHEQLHELAALVREGEQAAAHDPALALAAAAAWLARAMATLRRLELAGHPAREIRRLAADLRRTAAASPFLHRAQTWPRGYPGDFEIVEQIVDGRVDAAPATWPWFLERVVLDTAMVAQHRHKIAAQARRIAHCTRHRPAPAILALACGGARDCLHARDALHPDTTLVLNDTDPDALALAHRRLADTCRLHTAPGHALRCVLRLAKTEQTFDLILIGGLFDYLADATIRRILNIIHQQLLRPGGLCMFTNIAAANPFRPLMHHLIDWPLIERTEADLTNLCSNLAREALQIERDPTGLTLLATLTR